MEVKVQVRHSASVDIWWEGDLLSLLLGDSVSSSSPHGLACRLSEDGRVSAVMSESSDSPAGLFWHHPGKEGEGCLRTAVVSTGSAGWKASGWQSPLPTWSRKPPWRRCWGASVHPGESRSLGSPLGLYWCGCGWGHSFLWYLAGIEWLFSKFSVLLGYPFSGPLVRESRFLLGLFLSVPWCFQAVNFFTSKTRTWGKNKKPLGSSPSSHRSLGP